MSWYNLVETNLSHILHDYFNNAGALQWRHMSDREGIKTGSGGVCYPNARGHVRNRTSNPEGVSPRDLTYCSHKPECIGTTNPDRSVLITIITWHFQFHPVNVSNLHVKGAYVLEARAISRAAPIVTSCGSPQRWELSPHNTHRQGTLCSWGAASRL